MKTNKYLLLAVLIISGCGSVFGDEAQNLFESQIRMAKEGDVGAQTVLGEMYLRGYGVSKDYKEAVRWFRLAADQGDSYAQGGLGVA